MKQRVCIRPLSVNSSLDRSLQFKSWSAGNNCSSSLPECM